MRRSWTMLGLLALLLVATTGLLVLRQAAADPWPPLGACFGDLCTALRQVAFDDGTVCVLTIGEPGGGIECKFAPDAGHDGFPPLGECHGDWCVFINQLAFENRTVCLLMTGPQGHLRPGLECRFPAGDDVH